MSLDLARFANPPAEYRPVPFWSWNDYLDVERLIDQLHSLKKAGMGGFFMHSRPGIMTPFLSEEWFEAIRACIEEARAHGMQAWLYDEWSFPSGFAGGAVTETRPELARKWLLCRPFDRDAARRPTGEQAAGDFSAVFVVTPGGYKRVDPADEAALDAALAAKKAVAFEVTLQADPGTSWLGGFPYPDLLNREATEHFLELAYEPYRQRFAEHFGRTVPGMFTDEPNIRVARPQEGAALPWTPQLFARYEERYGKRLDERIIELFIDIGEYQATRHKYWRLVTDLFIESWMKPVYEWCDKNGLKLTGHLWEHEFKPVYSSSIMAPLEYMHYPGLDLLGRDHPTFRQPMVGEVPHQLGDVAMVKAVTSVGHQLGRERILSETYGAGGYEMSFEVQKSYGEWEFALGVTLLNQHLSHYSLRGYRKTDFPISFLDVQPWWAEYPALADRFGRLSYALSQGTFQAELLVLHPMASLWAEWAPDSQNPALRSRSRGERKAKELAVAFDHLLKGLSAHSWGYDLGDDVIIERHGSIDTGDADARPVCRVGQMRYQAIVIPPSSNLSSQTVRWVEEFAAKGGTVIAVTPLPTMVDGERADLAGFFSRCTIVRSVEELLVALAQLEDDGVLSRTVQTSTSTVEQPIYTHAKRNGDELVVFLTNVGAAPHLGEQVYLRGTGVVESLCLSTGEVTVLPTAPWEHGVVVELDFERGESHLLRLRPETAAALRPGLSQVSKPVSPAVTRPRFSTAEFTARDLKPVWRFQRLDPNVLVLDRLEYRIGDGPWVGPAFTAEAAKKIREHYGVNPYQYWDLQPWRKFGTTEPKVYDERITFRYRVKSETGDVGDLELVVEDAHAFEITVNGQTIHARTDWQSNRPTNGKPGRPWFDDAFRRLPIKQAWRAGENIIELTFRFSEDLSLEQAYLLGDFALSSRDGREFAVTAEPGTLKGGPWISQGYPFFVGKAVYGQTFELTKEEASRRIFVEFSELPSVARVFCNGNDMGLVAWPPYRLELTPAVRPGENVIEIRVASTAHNILGPLHYPTVPVLTTPAHYVHSSDWVLDYQLLPEGLARRVRLWIERES